MNSLDIPVAFSYNEETDVAKGCTLIYPLGHPIAQAADVHLIVRLMIISDEQYIDMAEAIEPEEDEIVLEPLSTNIYEVDYVRTCKAKDVARFEWKKNIGPKNLSTFMAVSNQEDGEYGYVKIVKLVPVYSLKMLNERYSLESK